MRVPEIAVPGSGTVGLDITLLLARVGLGLAIFAHGAQKLFGWFGGMGLSATTQQLTEMGYPKDAGRLAVVVGLGETIGGLGMMLGILVLPAAFVTAAIMLYCAAIAGGFFIPEGVKYEPLFAAGAVVIGISGPGRYALGRYIPIIRTFQFSYGQRAILMAVGMVGVIAAIRR
ncbi:DoxX family protein [Nocardia arthritidis]|nr:DoxX family protein [Nocardia arthritidis]